MAETRGERRDDRGHHPHRHVGSHVVRMLCRAGVRPRLLLRNPDRLDAELRDQVELAVGEGTALLHLRCGYFMTNLLMDLDGLRAGRLTTIRPLDEPMPWVDPRDIAAVATVRLLADDWTGRQVQAVHGPADLTWAEAAAALSTA